MIINLLNNTYTRLYSKTIKTLGLEKSIQNQSILIRSFGSDTDSNLIKQAQNVKLNNKNEINKFILPSNLVQALPARNQNLLQMKLQQLDQTNKLLLHLNKQIEDYPHKKINDNLNNYSVSNSGPSVKFIDYSFSKNIKGNLGNISAQSTSRVGIVNFVTKIVKSLFNSLSSLVGNIQFINQHDKLILRIKYYQNTLRKDSLYSNKNVNFIYKNILDLTKANKKLINKNINILNSEPFKATSYNYNYLNSTELSVPKRILIKYLKDLINLNLHKSSNNSINNLLMQNNNFIDFDVIDNKITNDKLIENNVSALPTVVDNKNIKTNKPFNNNLLLNLIKTNTSDYLNNKRLKSLRLIKNKPLLSKLIQNFNKEQLTKGDLVNINAGKFTQSVDPKILNKISKGVIGMKGTIGSTDYAPEYYNISNYLIATNFINSKSDLLIKEGKGNILFNNDNKSSILKWKLANRITKSIAALKLKYNNDYNELLNNIYNKIILNNQGSVFSTLHINKRINTLLNNKTILQSGVNNINTVAEREPGITKIFNTLKLILILKTKFNSVKTINSNTIGATNNNIIFNKIKQAFLSNIYYNNKTNNNNNILKTNINKFKALGIFLSKIFSKNVEIQLIRLWSIGLDSAIMAQIISKNSNFNNSRIIIRKLWKKIVINKAHKFKANRQNTILNGNKSVYNKINIFNNKYKFSNKVYNLLNNEKTNLKLIQLNDFIKDPSNLNTNPYSLVKPVGVSIKIAGRLASERIQPKKTIKQFKLGATSNGIINLRESHRFTSKNKRGAFSVSIKLGNSRNYSTNSRKKINNTQIVVWGTNLSSNVGNPRFNKIIYNMIELPFIIKSIIYGIIISDGYIGFASKNNLNARLSFKQSFDRFPYVWSVFNTLAHYCSGLPISLIGKRNNTTTFAVQFWTRSLPCFTKLHSSWYKNGIKIVPSDIYDYLTPIALAHWIMGDGKIHSHGLILCTDSFTNQDVARLINILIIKYGLNCTMIEYKTGAPNIYIRYDSMDLLRTIVTPYMLPIFYYKIHLKV